jgi:hypothetical protein
VTGLAQIVAHPAKAAREAEAAVGEAEALGKLRQIAMGMIVYLTDHKATFPASYATIHSQLLPYIKDARVWDNPGGAKFSFNEKLAGVAESSVAEPSKVVLVYEGTGGQLTFAHAGKAALAFDDGHVELVTPAQAKGLRWR